MNLQEYNKLVTKLPKHGRLSVCRFCAEKSNAMQEIPWIEWDTSEICMLFEKLTGIQLQISETYPEFVCRKCVTTLRQWAKSLQQFRQVNKFWQLYFSKHLQQQRHQENEEDKKRQQAAQQAKEAKNISRMQVGNEEFVDDDEYDDNIKFEIICQDQQDSDYYPGDEIENDSGGNGGGGDIIIEAKEHNDLYDDDLQYDGNMRMEYKNVKIEVITGGYDEETVAAVLAGEEELLCGNLDNTESVAGGGDGDGDGDDDNDGDINEYVLPVVNHRRNRKIPDQNYERNFENFLVYKAKSAAVAADEQLQLEMDDDGGDDDQPKIKRKKTSVQACYFCMKAFPDRQTLTQHVQNMHDPNYNRILDHVCDYCGISFHFRAELDSHHELLHQDQELNTLECRLCQKTFSKKVCYRRHIRLKHIHQIGKPVECPKCERTFPNSVQLITHFRSHNPNKYICDYCEQIFTSKDKIVEHMLQNHAYGKSVYECDICGDEFKSFDELEQHKFSTHLTDEQLNKKMANITDDKKIGKHFNTKKQRKRRSADLASSKLLSCPLCGSSVSHLTTLRYHLKSVRHQSEGGDAVWKDLANRGCYKCNTVFDTPADLLDHRFKFSSCAVFQCEICKRFMNTEQSLQYHVLRHKDVERPFTCLECGAQFIRNNDLELHHRRMHTDERPYQCEMCDRKFAVNCQLKAHHRHMHFLTPRFQCTECPQSFTIKNQLTIHLRSHTQEFPYGCDVCDQRFASSSGYNAHVRTITHQDRAKEVEQEVILT